MQSKTLSENIADRIKQRIIVGKYAVGYAISGAETHMKIIIPYLGEAKFVTPDGYKVKTVDGQVSGYENIILKGGTHSIILV